MTKTRIILRSFLHYWRKNLAVALGVAVSTAILTGSLVVGDSMKYSLQKLVDLRLGNVTHTLTAGDRYFSADLAQKLEDAIESPIAGVLILEGIAVVDGGQKRLPKVQILGVDSSIDEVFGLENQFSQLSEDEVIVSENMATRLDIEVGESVLFRIRKASLIPMNAPFVSDEEVSVPLRLIVKAVASKESMSRFSLHNSQTAPFNAFISRERLDNLMELDQKVNALLIAAEDIDKDAIEIALQEAWSLDDLGLKLKSVNNSNQFELSSVRVFLNEGLANSIINSQAQTKPILTYFVNTMSSTSGSTPYSFVTGIEEENLSDDEVLINSWLADDLRIGPGDSLSMSYFTVGPLKKLDVVDEVFIVKGIRQIEGFFGDKSLAPDLPGLSDAGNCRDWETGVPIDLESIRDKDEDYWDDFGSTPKAFVSLSKAEQLWANRFGTFTALRFDQESFNKIDFERRLHDNFEIKSLGFVVKDVRELGRDAALNGVNFAELFMGLSFFVLLAGIILSILLFNLTINSRIEQIGLMRSLGLSKRSIHVILLGESGLMALMGGILGLGLTLIYNKLLFAGLNGIWYAIIRTDVIFLKLEPLTLVMGLLMSVIISVIGLLFAIRRLLKRELVSLRKASTKKMSERRIKLEKLGFIVSGLLGIALPVFQFVSQNAINPGIFFMAGGLLLFSSCLGIDLYLRYSSKHTIAKFSIRNIAIKNRTRNRSQSLSIILLLALGTFLIVTVGANRKNHFVGDHSLSSGTGGFDYYAETTVPVLSDLNDKTVKESFNLGAETNFVQFRLNDGDDASCLNLNSISQPRILGVRPEGLEGRFSFASTTEWLDETNPWASLDQKFDDNIIPAIADQTVIQWSLLKSVGDTLWFTGNDGEEFGVLLIGGLANSVFQGNLLISESAFLDKFPSSSGSNVFLITGDQDSENQIAALSTSLRDFGIEIKPTPARLAEFSSVENTYLSIFLLLGALGLLIGTIGLGIVLARSVQERQQEIALQRSMGISKGIIFRGLLYEFSGLMIMGILIGSISALIAVFPGLISPGSEVQILSLIGLIGIIIVNGLIWISIFAGISMRKENLALVLKND